MGGFNGFTEAEYDALTDRAIVESYFAPRDDDHRLIPLRERRAGSKKDAASEWTRFPSAEELNIPPEAHQYVQRDGRPPGEAYKRLFWMLWRKWGASTDEILARWKYKVETGVSLPPPEWAKNGERRRPETDAAAEHGPGPGRV